MDKNIFFEYTLNSHLKPLQTNEKRFMRDSI